MFFLRIKCRLVRKSENLNICSPFFIIFLLPVVLKFTVQFTLVHLFTCVAKAVTSRRSRGCSIISSCWEGPSPNPRHGGVTPCERRAGLIRGWTAAGPAEIGTPGINRATFDSRPPLRRGGRGPLRTGPSLNPRHGGIAPCDMRAGLIRGWTATGRAELGRSGFNRATSVLRLPLRLGGRVTQA